LRFAQSAARSFLECGGVGRNDWQSHAEEIHRAFIARRLSPGGSADLLAATLFVASLEPAWVSGTRLCHDQTSRQLWRRSCQTSF
jgi:triphosphoribosyl-dephospho-CoA synthase